MSNARPGVRDSQRSKLYAAEKVVHGDEFVTVEEVQQYVDKVLGRAWFKRRWPSITAIPVEDGRGRRSACAKNRWGTRVISMPKWSRYEEVILHEIAHHCSDVQHGTRQVPAHGWQFAATLVELVRYAMGKDEADKMKASFREAKVRFAEPKKRKPMSPEQKAAAAERLAKARAEREAAKPVRAIVYRPTQIKPGWRYREEINWDRRVIVGARTKKEAAETLGVEYAEFVRDSSWFDKSTGQAGAGIAAAAKSIEDGEVRRFVNQATGELNQHGRPVKAWVEIEQVGDGLDMLRDLLTF